MSPRHRVGPTETRLDAILRERGIAIAELARELGRRYHWVHGVVAGHRRLTRPEAETFARACRVLGADATTWLDLI